MSSSKKQELANAKKLDSKLRQISSIAPVFEQPAIPWTEVDGTWKKPEYSTEQMQRLNRGVHGNHVPNIVVDAAKSGTLVPFLGAGTSCIPPTALPSWTAVTQAVLKGLWDRALDTSSSKQFQSYVNRFGNCIRDTLKDNDLPPEFFSEIIVNRLGDFYFNVLSVLDSDQTNSVHQSLAKLAQVGAVRVVVTTNFDTCIEKAMKDVGVFPIVYKGQATFDASALRQGLYDTPYDPDHPVCYVLKVHGSADDSSSVVDTLAQRSIGLPKEITDCVDLALAYGHWLVLGFSGADLIGDKNYLQIRPSMNSAIGYTWLNRYCEAPLDSVVQLTKDYPPGKAKIVYGELPEALLPLNVVTGASTMETVGTTDENKKDDQGSRLTLEELDTHLTLEERVKLWANKLIPEEALVVLIDLSLNTR